VEIAETAGRGKIRATPPATGRSVFPPLVNRSSSIANRVSSQHARIAPSQNLWGCTTRLSKQELSLGPIRMPRAGQRELGMSDAVL
jgi:hypothetical protein